MHTLTFVVLSFVSLNHVNLHRYCRRACRAAPRGRRPDVLADCPLYVVGGGERGAAHLLLRPERLRHCTTDDRHDGGVRQLVADGHRRIVAAHPDVELLWADLREDKFKIWPRVFGRFSAPWGPRRAPGALGRAPARKMVQVAPNIGPGDQFIRPVRGYFVFLVPAEKR